MIITEKQAIYRFLSKNIYLQIYSIADLEEVYWQKSVFYADRKDAPVRALALLFLGYELPLFSAFQEKDPEIMERVIDGNVKNWPQKMYGSFLPPAMTYLKKYYHLTSNGTHYKMGLEHPGELDKIDTSSVEPMDHSNLAELQKLLKISYPHNWFFPQLLATKQYFGIRREDKLISMGGVHVFSPAYRVAALGNVTTHPEFRKQGLASQIIAAVCKSLLNEVDYIGLNVSIANKSAISCYEKLGFEIKKTYEEQMMEKI